MNFKLKKSTFVKSILGFLLLSAAVMIGLLLWSTDADTWRSFLHFKWWYMPVLLVLAALRWFLDGMAFVEMAKHGAGSSLKVGRAAVIRLITSMIASIIPILVGTLSVHTYLLKKEKINFSESFAIATLRSIIPVFLFLVNIPIIFLMKGNPFGGEFFTTILEVISVTIVIVVLFFIVTLFYPHKIQNTISRLIHFWGRTKLIQVEKILKWEEKIFVEIEQFSNILWKYFKERKMMLVRASGWVFSAYFFDYLIAIVIIWGFGFNPNILKLLALQFLMKPIIYLAITPGGAGIWEVTYVGFFLLFMPKSLIGVSILLWRLLVSYLPSIAGSILLVREYKRDKALKQFLFAEGDLDKVD